MYLTVSCVTKCQLARRVFNKMKFIQLSHQCSSNYHSQSGVYGHKRKDEKPFKVDDKVLENRVKYSKAYQLISAYREHGHRAANVNPVSLIPPSEIGELELARYGLTGKEECAFHGLVNGPNPTGTIDGLADFLKRVYCGAISAEFCHLQDQAPQKNLQLESDVTAEDFLQIGAEFVVRKHFKYWVATHNGSQEPEEREWFAERLESIEREEIGPDYKRQLLGAMVKSQALDRFLATKFVSLKRYGGEGAESMLAFFIELFTLASRDKVRNLVIGAHHRGRLNLLIGLLEMPPQLLFRKLQGKSEFPEDVCATGDVISHLCPSADLKIDGRELHVDMTNLPSHLEAVCPVSLGKTRCLQQLQKEARYGPDPDGNWSDSVMNVQVHGDAALAGQGVTQESLLMSGLPHFTTGGTLHLVINNQLGFTTPPEYGRGTAYPTDVAKIISAPVLHVNGERPEDVVRATRIAVEYQRKFRKNVFVDLNCYRRWGHNELDDPTFTNPLIYAAINEKRSIPDMYALEMAKEGIASVEEVAEIEKSHSSYLNGCLKNVGSFVPTSNHLEGEWKGFSQAPNAITVWDTGYDTQMLQLIGAKSVSYPETFNVHPHLQKHHIQGRLSKIYKGKPLDWATAEALAFGSLLLEGYNVRISGQDVGRGTFSQRHALFVDQKTEDVFVPLNNISPNQKGRLEVANSLLSEEAVLGFEYGFSTVSPNNLVIWEAQFGDFFNGAQIQIDTYVSSGESKWCSMSNLVMVLPHGYDGAGPEHSSCRLERFLQLTDSSECLPDGEDINLQVAFPTTPAQYFHLLRRQMVRNYRKPLVIAGPKALFRAPHATSSMAELGPKTHFHPVLGDDSVGEGNSVRRVIFVTGKHFYALKEYRQEMKSKDVAIIRIEELCPFPTHQIRQQLAKFNNAKEFIWSQEEPQNMGAWIYCKARFENLVGHRLRYCGRRPMAAPACGVGEDHAREAQMVIAAPFQPFNKQSTHQY